MRRVVILAVALLLATATVAQGATGPKVSGTYTYAYGIANTTVVLDAFGTAPARGTFHWARDAGSPVPPSMSGDVVCVIVDGQDAWVIGVATESSDPLPAYFMARVRDSGLRAGAGDMAISFAGPGTPPPDCKMPLQWNLTAKMMVPISSGNILIH